MHCHQSLILVILSFLRTVSISDGLTSDWDSAPMKNIGNLEDELKQLPVGSDENNDYLLATDHSIVTANPIASELNEDEALIGVNQAVTEYALASTGTPQLLVSSNPSTTSIRKSYGEKETDKENYKDEDADDDDDDDDGDGGQEDHWEEMTTLSPIEETNQPSSVAPPTPMDFIEAPSFVDLSHSMTDKLKRAFDFDELFSNSSAEDESLQELVSSEKVNLKSPMIKKAGLMNPKQKSSAAYEDLMEIVIKVAEDPNDWKEIEQLLENIEYEDATFKKAKARLKALVMQKQIKLKSSKSNKMLQLKDKLSTKVVRHHQQQMSNAIKNRFRIHINNKIPTFKNDPHRVRITTLTAKQQPSSIEHKIGRPTPSAIDYAVEQPVTVIGERSRVDPIEKELVEESMSQRLREIQMQKARLMATTFDNKSNDDVEGQLKALSKMERRLKQHWHQKQKLMQKIKEKNKWKADRSLTVGLKPKW